MTKKFLVPIQISGLSATSNPLVIKGAVSQSANLQEWQNSAGTVLASVGADGSIYNNVASGGSLTTSIIMDNNAYGTGTGTQIVFKYGGGTYASISSIYSGTPVGPNMVFNVGSLTTPRMSINNNGTVTVNGFVAGSQGLIVKGAASQSANLQEWQNSAGATRTSILSDGALFSNMYATFTNAGAGGGTAIYARTIYADSVPVAIRGAASQTANLQEWQNSAGTVLAKVDSAGNLNTTGGLFVGDTQLLGYSWAYFSRSGATGLVTWNQQNYAGAGLLINSGNAGTVPLQVKSAASQTANLQEWQNSAGYAMVYINKDGNITTAGNISSNYLAVGYFAIIGGSYNSVALTVKGTSGQTNNLQEWQSSSGYNAALTPRITASGAIQAGDSNKIGYQDSYFSRDVLQGLVTWNQENYAGASFRILIGNAASQGLIIKSASSQSANLLEFQNSSGNAITYVTATGHITATSAAISTLYSGGQLSSGTLGYFNATTFAPSVSPIIVRGTASQTADLTQWQNSAGAVLAAVSNGGSIYGTGIYASYLMQVTSGLSSQVAMTVKGASSQTAKLQEWQNSSGTVLASINNNGVFETTASIYTPYIQPINGGGSYLSLTQGNPVTAITTSASVVPLAVKGAASQTADLQQWVNSAGTVIANVTSGGVVKGTEVRTVDNTVALFNGGLQLNKKYSSSLPYATDYAILQIVAGAITGTLKLVIQAGSNGAATTIIDNIDQSNGVANTQLITAPSSSSVGLIVKGVTSQTANLQEWQNSAGSVLASVSSSGGFELNGKDVELMNIMGAY